jgi:hypothetical protein
MTTAANDEREWLDAVPFLAWSAEILRAMIAVFDVAGVVPAAPPDPGRSPKLRLVHSADAR